MAWAFILQVEFLRLDRNIKRIDVLFRIGTSLSAVFPMSGFGRLPISGSGRLKRPIELIDSFLRIGGGSLDILRLPRRGLAAFLLRFAPVLPALPMPFWLLCFK
jgi:hypothetical protein